MKTMLKIMAVALVAVMMCTVLASCANTLNGKYTGTMKVVLVDVKYTYEFKGNNVTVTTETPVFGTTIVYSQTGTYEIKDDQITFTWSEGEEKDGATVVETGPYKFEKGSDYIKIGDMTLTKDK